MARRLVAILAIDVVGYSRLMAEGEAATLKALKAFRKAVFEPAVAEHGGRVVKLMGDGALVEFASAVDALACALAVRRSLDARLGAADAEPALQLRIGIHLGDVILEDGDLYGDGVNLAARIEAACPPDAICISQQVYDQVANKLEITIEDLGEQRLRNIDRPVRIYRVRDGAAEPGEAAHDRPAVAVLPFVNMSADPEQEYFSDGLSEDLITALAAWRSIPVIARTSSFTYKGRSPDLKQVGRELGARYILEGSVRRAGERIRVTAQLIDSETGHHIWAERYDRPLEDVFALQDELTRRIVATIEPELEAVELRRSAADRPASLSAWDCHLRGWAALYRYSCAGNAEARGYFTRATELDPDYSDAWTGLAFSYLRDLLFEACTDDRDGTLAAGFAAAERAVALDDASSMAHLALGTAFTYADRNEPGIAETEIAVRLNPSNAHALMALGNRLDLIGRAEEGLQQLEYALRLNPRDPRRPYYLRYLSRARLGTGKYVEALEAIDEALRARPNWADLHYRRAIVLGHLDRVEEARTALAECERLEPGFVARKRGWRPYRDERRNAELFDGLRRHNLIE